MSNVTFVSNQTDFKLKQASRHRTWVERIIIANHKFPSDIQFIFSTDDFIADLNKQYLHHSTLTDISHKLSHLHFHKPIQPVQLLARLQRQNRSRKKEDPQKRRRITPDIRSDLRT